MVKKLSKKQYFLILCISLGIILTPLPFIYNLRQTNNANNQNLLIIALYQQQLPPLEQYPDGIVYHLHATWSSENASTTITFTWRINNINESAIKYDNISRGGISTSYSWENISYGQIFYDSYLHSVALKNLTANTTYYFICGSDEGGWTDELKFRTPAISPQQIIFVAGGDSRSQPSIRNSISNLMKNYNPEFALHTGDIISDGSEQSLWDIWFDGMDQYWRTNNNYTIPIMPSIGNHEQNASNYYSQFALPNNEQWFSMDYSSLLHIVSLSSSNLIDGEQLTWLKNDLKQYNDTPWKIVLFHEPPYCAGGHEPRLDIRSTWGPIFDEYNVSIVFNGHNHLYERTNPIKNNATSNSYLNGTMYITTGGWGAPLHSINPQWWTNYTESSYHFCVINITTNFVNSTLELNMIRLNSSIGDTITIVKDLL